MSTMKFCSRQSSNGTMRSMKILTSSQASNDHDELAQSLSHHLTCQARLTMPVKASELDETCSLRLEQPHNPTMAAGNHRKINSQIPVLLLSGLDSSKTTNSLTRAIITKQYDNEKKKISSSMKCPNQDHNNNNRPKRQVYALRSTLFKTQRLTLVDRASSSAKLSPLNYLIVTLALSSCLFITHIGAFEGPSASLGETSSAVDQASAKRDQAQDGAANKAAIERSDSSAGSSVLKSLESSPAATASSSPSASSSSQKSIVASLSSAVATAAAAAAVAAAQNGLSNNDARSLTTSGSRRQNAQGNTHRSPGLNLAIKLVDTIPEVPYNILHNMKKVEHAAPFYNQPNKFSNGAPKESTQNFLANALTATGASEQLAVLFKSPLWKRIADGYGDFASEFRSLFHAPGAKPMKGPSSATSKLLRDISVPALLMLIASSISGEWRPVRTRRKSFRPVDIPAGSSLHQKSPQLSGSLASILADPSTSSSSSSSSSSSPSSLAAPADAVEQQQPASVAAQYFQRYEQSQRPQFDRPFVGSQAQPAVGGGYWPMPVQNNDWLHQIQQQQAGLAFGQQMSQVGQQQPQQQSSVRDEVNLRGSELFPTNWIAPDQHQASSSLVDGNLKSFISPNGNDQQQSAFDLQPSATTLGQQQQAVMVRRSGDMIITDGQHQFVGEGGQLASSPAIDSPSSSFPIASNPISPAFAYNHGSKLIAKLLNVANDGHSYRMMSDPLADHNVNDGMSSIKRGDQLNDNQMYSLIASPDEISANSAPASVASLQPAENGGVHELLSAKESSTRRERKEQQQQHRQPLLLSAMAQTMASMLGSRSATGSGRSGSQSSSSGIGAAAAVSPLASLFNAANSNKQNFMTTTGGDKTIINEQHRSNNHNQVLMRRQQQSAEQRDLTKLLPETWREVVKRTMTTVQQQANTQWKSIEGQLANWVQDKLKTVAASATSNSPNQATSGGSSGGSSPVGSVPAPIGNMLASVSSTALNILGLHKNNHNNSSHSPNQAGSSSSSLHTANSVSQASEQPGATSASNQRGKVELMKAALNQQQQQPANSKGTLAGVANLIVSTISNRNSPKQSSSPLSTSSSTHHNNQSSQSQPITTTTTNNEKLKSQPLGEIAASVASVALTNFASKYPTLTGNNASPHSSPQVPTSQSASPLKPASTTTTTSTTTSSTTTTAPTS